MRKVLVIEDAIEIREIVKFALKQLSMDLDFSESIIEAERRLSRNHFNLIILDLNLPDGDGLDLLGRLRQNKNYKTTPVIVLSSKIDMAFKLCAFSLGADDYMTKPFNNLELRARVECLFRRISQPEEREEIFEAGPFTLNPAKQTVLVRETGEIIHLTSTEFRIFALLSKRPDVIYTRNQILDHVWGEQIAVTDRTVDSHIYSLRKKLGEESEYIQAVKGEGYRFLESPLSCTSMSFFDEVKKF